MNNHDTPAAQAFKMSAISADRSEHKEIMWKLDRIHKSIKGVSAILVFIILPAIIFF